MRSKGQGFLDDVEHLPQHLPQVQKGTNGTRYMVMDVYFVQFFSSRSLSAFS